MDREQCLSIAPDEPRFVQARGSLLAGYPIQPAGAGAALVVDRRDDLAMLLGAAPPEALADAARAAAVEWLLVQPEAHALARDALPGWSSQRATLHTLDPGVVSSWPPVPDYVRVIPHGALQDDARGTAGRDGLQHVPGDLRWEVVQANACSPIVCVENRNLLVSFAYGAYHTETLVDVSIDTLQPWRRRGFAADASRALVRSVVDGGRRPVWGALEHNEPSLRLAARLGFEPCGVLYLLQRR
jgi:RimJ/RimL family protein N-acetyltransferase